MVTSLPFLMLQSYPNFWFYPYSRGAMALLINRASGKGLIVDSTSANGPLFRIPFLTSTGWCKKYFLYVFSIFAIKKGRKSSFFSKNKYFDFFTVTHHNIFQLIHKYKKTIKDVLVSIKPKFSNKFFNFNEKNSNFTIFRKVQIILKITKKLE